VPISVLNRAGYYDYGNGLDLANPSPFNYGDSDGGIDNEQCVMEFDINPKAIDTSVPVTIKFRHQGGYVGTKKLRRWKNAFPTDFATMTSTTALDSATNELTFTESAAESVVTLDIKNLVADMATNNQPKVILGIPEGAVVAGASIYNDAGRKPTLTYTLKSVAPDHGWSPSIDFASNPALNDLIGSADLTATSITRTADNTLGGRWYWSFNGLTSKLEGDVDQSLFAGSSAKFSGAAWIYRPSGSIYSIMNSYTSSGNLRQWYFQTTTGNQIYLLVADATQTNWYTFQSNTTALVSNTWYHVAFSYDASLSGSARGKLWINGISQAITFNSSGVPTIANVAAQFTIGMRDGANPFNGRMDSMFLFMDHVLTESEVVMLASSRQAGHKWLGDNFESYSGGASASTFYGWSTGSDSPLVTLETTNRCGIYTNSSSSTNAWMERIAELTGEIDYDWMADTSGETVYVSVNGSVVNTHTNGGAGTLTAASVSVTAGDLVRFAFTTTSNDAAIDNINFTDAPSAFDLFVNNADVPVVIDGFKVSVNLTVNGEDVPVHVGAGSMWVETFPVNGIDIPVEITAGVLSTNRVLTVFGIDVPITIFGQVGANLSLTVNGVAVPVVFDSVQVIGNNRLNVNNIDVPVTVEQVNMPFNLYVNGVDVPITISGQVLRSNDLQVNGLDVPITIGQVPVGIELRVDNVQIPVEIDGVRVTKGVVDLLDLFGDSLFNDELVDTIF
jgi:hypothetical protein